MILTFLKFAFKTVLNASVVKYCAEVIVIAELSAVLSALISEIDVILSATAKTE